MITLNKIYTSLNIYVEDTRELYDLLCKIYKEYLYKKETLYRRASGGPSINRCFVYKDSFIECSVIKGFSTFSTFTSPQSFPFDSIHVGIPSSDLDYFCNIIRKKIKRKKTDKTKYDIDVDSIKLLLMLEETTKR